MSNVRVCEKCNGAYLVETGHDCPMEPKVLNLPTDEPTDRERLDAIVDLLNEAYDDGGFPSYHPDIVAKAHRIAAGGELPRETKQHNTDI